LIGLGKVNRDIAPQALQRIRATGVDVLGLICNQVSFPTRLNDYGYEYGYHYNYAYSSNYQDTYSRQIASSANANSDKRSLAADQEFNSSSATTQTSPAPSLSWQEKLRKRFPGSKA
jgi:hypothetical protein